MWKWVGHIVRQNTDQLHIKIMMFKRGVQKLAAIHWMKVGGDRRSWKNKEEAYNMEWMKTS